MRIAAMLGLLGLWGGCFTALQDGGGQGASPAGGGAGGCVGASCHHAAGGGAGGSSGGAASSGSTGGGSSGGSTAGGATANGTGTGAGGSSTGGFTIDDGGLDGGDPCSPDLYMASTVVDLAGRTPIAGAVVSAVGVNGVPIQGASATSSANGAFVVCVPGEVEFDLQVTATGYPESVLEDTELTTSENLVVFYNGLPLLSQEDLTALSGVVPYNPSLGAVLVSINSISGTAPCQDASGWEVSLAFPDGGSLPDGGALPFSRVYLNDVFLPDPTLQVTAANGDAFFYDVDPNLTDRVAIVAVNTNPDAGACPISNDVFGLQGTAYIAPQVLTFGPIMLP